MTRYLISCFRLEIGENANQYHENGDTNRGTAGKQSEGNAAFLRLLFRSVCASVPVSDFQWQGKIDTICLFRRTRCATTQVRTGMVSVSDGKSNPEPTRLRLTMELLVLQKLDTSTPSGSLGPPSEVTDIRLSRKRPNLTSFSLFPPLGSNGADPAR